jgi:beta-lactamase superfamily II metal-dependent hydrolase
MSVVKSFSVGEGDMFYIKHGSDSFTTIDCCLNNENQSSIMEEIKEQSKNKGITRFISTHPDEDHFSGLEYYDSQLHIINFYCVKNEATKEYKTIDFKKYCKLRDSEKAYYLKEGCTRKWLNENTDERGSAGISILWPITSNKNFQDELRKVKEGKSPNNISPIIKYSTGKKSFLWMGDLETSFMERIEDELTLPKITILFAPHHGRKSGSIPTSLLKQLDPEIIVIGEAPSEDIDYYSQYNTITQNSAGDIVFDCQKDKIHIYVSNKHYSVDFLDYYDEDYQYISGLSYLGTLFLENMET